MWFHTSAVSFQHQLPGVRQPALHPLQPHADTYCFCHLPPSCSLQNDTTLPLQTAVATAIIVITALKLHKVSVGWNADTYNADVSNVCLLGHTEQGGNLCYFAYIVSGISIIATGILSLLQCCTCNLCGLGTVLDAIFAAAGTVLWAVAGVMFNWYQKLPAMAAVPRQQWRHSIPILCFTACTLFGIMCLAAIYSIFAACCCGGSKRGYKSRGGRNAAAADIEAAPAKLAQPVMQPVVQQQQQPMVYLPPVPAGYPAQQQQVASAYPLQSQFVLSDGASYDSASYWGTGAARFYKH
jgi:mannose-P-dolichol utilization defect protein 1